jgi:hypothetical protein
LEVTTQIISLHRQARKPNSSHNRRNRITVTKYPSRSRTSQRTVDHTHAPDHPQGLNH